MPPLADPACSGQLADRPEIEVQILGLEAELLREITNRLFEPHQREADRLCFLGGQGVRVHSPDCLALQNLADEFHERQHELQHRPANVVRIGVPPGRRGARKSIQLGSQRLEFLDLDWPRGRVPATWCGARSRDGRASRPWTAPGSLYGHKSGANANG